MISTSITPRSAPPDAWWRYARDAVSRPCTTTAPRRFPSTRAGSSETSWGAVWPASSIPSAARCSSSPCSSPVSRCSPDCRGWTSWTSPAATPLRPRSISTATVCGGGNTGSPAVRSGRRFTRRKPRSGSSASASLAASRRASSPWPRRPRRVRGRSGRGRCRCSSRPRAPARCRRSPCSTSRRRSARSSPTMPSRRSRAKSSTTSRISASRPKWLRCTPARSSPVTSFSRPRG